MDPYEAWGLRGLENDMDRLEARESVLSEENARLRRLLANARVGLWAAAEALGYKSQKRAFDTVTEALRRSDELYPHVGPDSNEV